GEGARQKSPTEGDSILVPLAGAASPAGDTVGGTVAEEASATGGNGGSPAVAGPAGCEAGPLSSPAGNSAPGSPIRAMTAPTGAVSFSCTRISSNVPATSAS